MTAETISPKELKENLDKFTVIDVREPDEEGCIGSAKRIPLGKLIRDLGTLSLGDKELVVYCRGGVRGQIAADFLKSKGYKVRNLEGGFKAYQ